MSEQNKTVAGIDQEKFGAEVARRLNAIRPVSPAGALAMSGPTGTGFAPLPANLRDRRAIADDPLHPWKVFAVGKSEEVDHFFEIYIPEGSITVGSKNVEVEGIEETETPRRYTFDCESEVGKSSTLYLVVLRKDKSEEKEESEEEEEEDNVTYRSVLAVNAEDVKPEDDESVIAIIPLAELSVVAGDDRFDRGKVVSQIEREAIRIDDLTVNVDGASIDKNDDDAIQIKDFNGSASDGGQGLAQRLDLEKSGSGESATYRIVAKDNDSAVHLIARVNGKIKYIPLSGSDEKDEDEQTDPEDDPNTNCPNHPGSADGGGVETGPGHGGAGSLYSGGVYIEDGGGEGSSGVGCDC